MAKTKSFTEELLFGFESEKKKKESNNVVEKKIKPISENNSDSLSDKTENENATEESNINLKKEIKKEEKMSLPQEEEEKQELSSDDQTNTSIKKMLEDFVKTENTIQKKIYITRKLDELSKTAALYADINTSQFIRDAIIEYLNLLSNEYPDLKKIIEINLSKEEK